MDTIFRNLGGWVLGLVTLAIIALPVLAGEKQIINKNPDDIAIEGYDTVAYFTEGRPVEGKADFEFVWQDAQWRFANASHRDKFAANPERYAPRYGGYCAMAMARGQVYKVDPEAWVIVKDKLYLNYSKKYSDDFVVDTATNIANAEANWVTLGKAE